LAATIADVARLANVSTATVSRVLNGYPFISSDVRERVEAAMRKSSYRPNIHARRLNNKDLNTMCFALSNCRLLDAEQAAAFMGLSVFCRDRAYQTIFIPLQYGPDQSLDASSLQPALESSSDTGGVVLGGTNYPNLLRFLDAQQVRHVVLGNALLGSPVAQTGTIWYDDTSAAREAVGHLVELGHKDIRFLGDVASPMTRRRYEGYRQGMLAAGLASAQPIHFHVKPMPEEASAENDNLVSGSCGPIRDVEGGTRSIVRLQSQADLPTGIVCGNDAIAHGVVRGLGNAGLRVPDDVSVIGFGDLDAAAYTDPALTTFRIPWLRIGATAARMLLPSSHPDRLHDLTYVLPVKFVPRKSTGRARRPGRA